METKKFLDGEGLKTLWDEITALQSDYNETDETSPNYIKNKPFTIDVTPEEVIEEFTFTTSDTIDESTGLPTMQYVQLFSDLTIGQKMNLQFTYPELAAATGLPQYDDNGEVIFKIVRYENIEVGNFADAMGSEFLDSPAIMMGPGALIATLPESIQKVAIPNDDIVFVYSNATLADGTKTPLLITALIDWTTGEYSTYVNNCMVNTFIPENVEFNADPITKQMLQANWDQSNKEEVDYIKNKPFGEEILITPINEIYIKDFPLLTDDNSSIRYADFSLGLEVDKTYTIKIYDKDNSLIGIVTAVGVEAQSAIPELPAGIKLLYASDADEILAADGLDFDENGNPIYAPNKTILFDIDDDIYKSEIVELPANGRTYDRIKIKKIPSKYLEIDVDQEFNETSENPQSGISVSKAILQLKNKLPSSVITSLTTPTTLGDQHVKVQFDSTNANTYPNSVTYDIYTEGIGLNSDLNTTNKDTLVAAINETNNNINDAIAKAKKPLSWHFPTDAEASLFHTADDGINQEVVLLKNDKVAPGALPSYSYSCFIKNQANLTNLFMTSIPRSRIMYSTFNDIICIYDRNTWKIYFMYGAGSISEIWDLHDCKYTSSDQVNTFFKNNSVHNMFCMRESEDEYAIYLVGNYNTADETTAVLRIYRTGSVYKANIYNYIYQFKSTYLPIGSVANSYYNSTNFILPTDTEKPGKLEWLSANYTSGIICVFGQDDWSNAQMIYNRYYSGGYGSTFKRALDSTGIEYAEFASAYTGTTQRSYTGIDNNEHSAYYALDASNNICLSSSKELLYRSTTDASITKRVPIDTDTDLFEGNLQYASLAVANNTLFVLRNGYLYAIDYLSENPVAIKYEEPFIKNANSDSVNNSIGLFAFNDTFLVSATNFNSNIKVALLRNILDPNKVVEFDSDSIEFIFDGGNAPIE